MRIDNATPLAVERFVVFDRQGRELLVVVVKGTWEIASKGEVVFSESQDPIEPSDRYAGEPGATSLLAEGELTLPKPATDVVFTGHAVAPKPGTKVLQVSVTVGRRRQTANVYGERRWTSTLGVDRMSGPVPFERIPLDWEHAFGGVDASPADAAQRDWVRENPIGRGFVAAKTRKKAEEVIVPSIEDPASPYRALGERIRTVGFLPIAPHWEPRKSLAGTYDEAWTETRAPLVPSDFDERFLLTAPVGLRGDDRLVGGESCEIVGTTEAGALRFALPGIRPEIRAAFAGASFGVSSALDTVHVDTDAMKLHLVWRGGITPKPGIDALRAVEVDQTGS